LRAHQVQDQDQGAADLKHMNSAPTELNRDKIPALVAETRESWTDKVLRRSTHYICTIQREWPHHAMHKKTS